MKTLLIAFALLLLPAFAQAQAAPTDRFTWTMAHPSTVAQTFRYDVEIDTVVQPAPLVTTCTGATPATCTASIPAVTPSQHIARVRGVDISGPTPIVGEWSDLITFTMRATPSKPGGFGITPGK